MFIETDVTDLNNYMSIKRLAMPQIKFCKYQLVNALKLIANSH